MKAMLGLNENHKELFYAGADVLHDNGEHEYFFYIYSRDSAHLLMERLLEQSEDPDLNLPPEAHDGLLTKITARLNGTPSDTRTV